MKRVYLKLATRSLVLAASINAAVRPFWIDPLLGSLKADANTGRYADALVILAHVVSLLIIYKGISWLLLGIFDNVVAFRQILEKDFDVEGVYAERVYINGELEVVGRSEIGFSDGELRLESYAYWPKQNSDGSFTLARVAQITSVSELCSVKDLDMQYVFQDKYLETPQSNKTGLTKLTFLREQHPDFWRKVLWRRGRLTEYSGGFDSYDKSIDGTIVGSRLSSRDSKTSRAEDTRVELLSRIVKEELLRGKKLRTTPPGQ